MQQVANLAKQQMQTMQQIPSAHQKAQTTQSKASATSSQSGNDLHVKAAVDMLFAKFAVFFGHLWRSQFKDENFREFAKQEWFVALKKYQPKAIEQAVLQVRDSYEMPPTLRQVAIECSRQQERFDEHKKRQENWQFKTKHQVKIKSGETIKPLKDLVKFIHQKNRR